MSQKSSENAQTTQNKTNDAKESSQQQADAEKCNKNLQLNNSILVDSNFPRAKVAKIVKKNGIVYAKILNHCNIHTNNSKFYILQLLQEGINDYTLYCRWGRVGSIGQAAQISINDIDLGIEQYEKKLKQKLNNGYSAIQIQYQNEGDEQNNVKKQQQQQLENKPQSKLPKQVQNIIQLMFNRKIVQNYLKQMEYDYIKLPLDKLPKIYIKKCYDLLNWLMKEIHGQKRVVHFHQLSSGFYVYIPHDFGFQSMDKFVLDTQQKIKGKLQMLQNLQYMQSITQIQAQSKLIKNINQIDLYYQRLKTQIIHLDKNSQIYHKLIKCVKNTHGPTHNNYQIEVQQIFQLHKKQQTAPQLNQIHNKQLLWYGSRLSNFVGILSQGFIIPPPQGPKSSYLFGKGIYFTDMASKAANYCFANKDKNIGLMLLCEVALGNCQQKFEADYQASNLPPGMHSTKAVGKIAPKSGQLINGIFAPNQQCGPSGIENTSLLYNQYIVYNTHQIKPKYLFQIKFHYK